LHNEDDYEKAISLLDSLVDMVGENESHPLAMLMELVSVLIENYEDAYVPAL
jgi:HTH-type transcriptional regulator/antitoxin HigA